MACSDFLSELTYLPAVYSLCQNEVIFFREIYSSLSDWVSCISPANVTITKRGKFVKSYFFLNKYSPQKCNDLTSVFF